MRLTEKQTPQTYHEYKIWGRERKRETEDNNFFVQFCNYDILITKLFEGSNMIVPSVELFCSFKIKFELKSFLATG